MKKIIIILIAIFCVSNFTSTIEAANQYTKYQNNVKKSAKRSTRSFKKHKRNNTGRFHSLRTGKPLCGVQSLTYQKINKKCY